MAILLILDLVAAFLHSHSQKALVPLLQTCQHFGPWLTRVLDHVDNTLRVAAACRGAWAVCGPQPSHFRRPHRATGKEGSAAWSSTAARFAISCPAGLFSGRTAGDFADSGDVFLAFPLGSFLRNVPRPSGGRRNGGARGIHGLSPRFLGVADNHPLRLSIAKRR